MDTILLFLDRYGTPALVTAVISYFLGSISFSIIITKFYNRRDIRTMGSGNAGATNVLRSVGAVPAILTSVGDFGKAVLAISAGRYIFERWSYFVSSPKAVIVYGAYIAGFCCFIGHLYPIYFKFKGGKGVWAAAAMVLMIDWRVFLIILGAFVITFICTRIVSLSSIVSGALYPVITWVVTYFFDRRTNTDLFTRNYVFITTAISALMGLMIIFKHRENLKRLFKGTEKPISFKAS